MIPINECREYLPASLSDDEVESLRALLYEFWGNILHDLEVMQDNWLPL